MNENRPQPHGPSSETTQSSARRKGAVARSNLTRLVATLVLIPTVPMLFGSVGALALFYAAPTRFGRFIDRLPGDDLIRSALVFAPATLFGVVVLAFLYALERPGPAIPRVLPRRRLPTSIVDWFLLLAIPLLLLSAGAWVARFIAPGRFAALLEPLPATSYLQKAVSGAPPVLFLLVMLALTYRLFTARRRGLAHPLPGDIAPAGTLPQGSLAGGAAKLAAGLVLVPSLPMLFLSLAALGIYTLSPDRMESLVTKLSQATVLRLGLIFMPAVLLALVLMAGLYLFASTKPPTDEVAGQRPVELQERRFEGAAGTVAVVILLAGVVTTVLIGLGILAAVTWLLLR